MAITISSFTPNGICSGDIQDWFFSFDVLKYTYNYTVQGNTHLLQKEPTTYMKFFCIAVLQELYMKLSD